MASRGTPLAVSLTGGNRDDITEMIPLVDAIPPVPRTGGCASATNAAATAPRPSSRSAAA